MRKSLTIEKYDRRLEKHEFEDLYLFKFHLDYTKSKN